jgi:hypothetical protein
MIPDVEETNGIEPVGEIGARQEASHAYVQAARSIGHSLRGTGISALLPTDDQNDQRLLANDGLDELVPKAGRSFALAFFLAALRPSGEIWLGSERLKRLADSMHLEEPAVTRLLDQAPQPPATLGDSAPWIGRRVPVLQSGTISWLEFFWRTDRNARILRIGAFAVRMKLTDIGRVEIRGRLELYRLDAVMETERSLPKPLAADTVDRFNHALLRLGLDGTLTIRSANAPAKT